MLALELLTLFLEKPTNDSVETAIAFLKECGLYLSEVSPRGLHGEGLEWGSWEEKGRKGRKEEEMCKKRIFFLKCLYFIAVSISCSSPECTAFAFFLFPLVLLSNLFFLSISLSPLPLQPSLNGCAISCTMEQLRNAYNI